MSSNKAKEDEEKNNIINEFSRNFYKCYQKLKYSKEKNNKMNNNNSKKEENNIELFNSLIEFDFLNNSVYQNKKNKSKIKSAKKSPVKTNTSKYILSSSSVDNYNPSTNIPIQTTTVQSAKIKKLKNKYLNSLNKQKLEKNKKVKNLKKCSFYKKKFSSFIERLKKKQKKKEFHLNNIRSKSLQNEVVEMHTCPEINKKSKIILENSNKRKPLFQKNPLNEEKNLDKNFKSFYNQTLKENQTNIYNAKNKKNKTIKNHFDDKYRKFYEDKIKWKKNVEYKTKNRKLNIEQEYDDYYENFPFKPHIDENSINIVNKLNRNKSIENFSYNIFYENENDKENLDKFKARIKPIINDYYNYKNCIPKIYKKRKKLKRNLSEIQFNSLMDLNYDYNIINDNYKINKNIYNKKKAKINYKLNEKKYLNKNNKDKNKNNALNNLNIKKNNYLIKQIKDIKNKTMLKDEEENLYKINVRPGAAWNKEVVNKITPLKGCEKFLEGLL